MILLVARSGMAHHMLPEHRLQCSDDFPCPSAIQPRVHFWIEVFRSWDKETAILHDPDRPERVYAVFKTGKGCSRSVKSKVNRKRDEVRKSLQSVAYKLEKKKRISKSSEKHLLELFPSKNPREIRQAAKDIRCQSGVRDSFVAGLKRFNSYSPMVDRILAESGLPADIRYLPFVESSYNPAAYSKAGAAGMWQIMPKTARNLGLELNATIDERLEPEAATRAAARYLKDAEKRLTETARAIDPTISAREMNPFIITSYNYGVNGMRRAIKKVEPDYMQVLNTYKSPAFQVAVKNFYSSFLAARHVARNADTYFGNVARAGEGQYQTVVLQHATSVDRVKRVFGLSEKELKPLNTALTRFVWHGWRLIPAGYRLRLPYRKDNWSQQKAQLASMAPEKVISGGDRYTVRKGDTACGVARALKVNCSELIRANNLNKKATIRVGQKLEIPRRLVVASADSGTTAKAFRTSTGSKTYHVRPGDSACGIAQRFGVSCRTLISHNRLGRKAVIHPGQALEIPGLLVDSGRPTGLNADKQYIVRRGDTACVVAERFSVSCRELRRVNRLNSRATIYVGQKLKIPGLVVPGTSETAQQLARVDVVKLPSPKPASGTSQPVEVAVSHETKALLNLLDTLPDLGITVTSTSGSPVYTARVEADETLGHFADWLGIGTSKEIRQLNHLKNNRPLVIGKRLVLPVRDARMVERFEQRRTEYHQVLSESLKEHYDITGIESYTVRNGDSIWSMSVELGFPVWLLYRLNPILRSTRLKPGQVITLPKLRAKA